MAPPKHFAPLGDDLLKHIWDTALKDYERPHHGPYSLDAGYMLSILSEVKGHRAFADHIGQVAKVKLEYGEFYADMKARQPQVSHGLVTDARLHKLKGNIDQFAGAGFAEAIIPAGELRAMVNECLQSRHDNGVSVGPECPLDVMVTSPGKDETDRDVAMDDVEASEILQSISRRLDQVLNVLEEGQVEHDVHSTEESPLYHIIVEHPGGPGHASKLSRADRPDSIRHELGAGVAEGKGSSFTDKICERLAKLEDRVAQLTLSMAGDRKHVRALGDDLRKAEQTLGALRRSFL